LNDANWKAPAHGIGADPGTNEGDVNVKVYTKLKFTSSDKYQVWSSLFTIIFITLGVVALLSFLFFLRMTCVYQNYALERRELKRALINLKDTEYANFLLDQKKSLDANKSSDSLNQSTTDYSGYPSTNIQEE
jgi:hypothetical protein